MPLVQKSHIYSQFRPHSSIQPLYLNDSGTHVATWLNGGGDSVLSAKSSPCSQISSHSPIQPLSLNGDGVRPFGCVSTCGCFNRIRLQDPLLNTLITSYTYGKQFTDTMFLPFEVDNDLLNKITQHSKIHTTGTIET